MTSKQCDECGGCGGCGWVVKVFGRGEHGDNEQWSCDKCDGTGEISMTRKERIIKKYSPMDDTSEKLTWPWLIAHGFQPDGDNGAGELSLRIWAKDENESYGIYPAMQIVCDFEAESLWLESYGTGGETLCLVELPIDYTQEALTRLCEGMGQKLREVK